MWSAILVLLSLYFVVSYAGVNDAWAAFLAPAAAALVAMVVLRRSAREGADLVPEPVRRAKLVRRVLGLVVLAYLSEAVVSGVVAGFVPLVPPGGSPDQAVATALRLNTVVALPVALLLEFGVGILSAKWLTVSRPFRWLAAISVVPIPIVLALRPVATALSRENGTTPPRDLAESAPRTIAVTILVFCVLALGNLRGRKLLTEAGFGDREGAR
ncbi:hypothetical protein ACIBF5_21635 [Micromonospora sp. NPDC050417]|uniref:hypothetical protein n=1 Tax=Micromonospora sp. NPDC050417 TaxID=3364280 RepID=UPI0037AC1B6D